MGQRADATRFSLCNCMTVHWPNTYTAHALTMEAFCRHARPGGEWLAPRAQLWPSGYVRLYRFPRRVDTFLFSPFNEAFQPPYLLDGERVTIGPHRQAAALKKLAAPLPRYGLADLVLWLNAMAEHVVRIWAPKLCALVVYDSTRAGAATRARVRAWDETAEKVLGWPTIRVVDPDSRQKRWCHYDPRAHEQARAELALLENAAGVAP